MQSDQSVAQLVGTYDLFDPAQCERMHEYTEYARNECPVPHTSAGRPAYQALTYADVREVLEHHEIYSSAGEANIVGAGGLVTPPIDTDPPLHHDVRKMLNPFFHPKRLAESEPVVRELARARLASWIDSGRCDIVADYTPFITDVLATVIFHEDDLEVFRLAEEYNGRVAMGDASAFQLHYELLTEFVHRRRAEPRQDDVVTTILNSTIGGRPMTEAEQVGCVLILFAGGLDTTKVAIANIVARLAEDPSLEEVIRTPGWEKRTLDEFLRLDTPVSALGRVVVKDTTLHGQPIKAGERVDVYFASANRDASVFTAPDKLDVQRDRNTHLAFGLGIHRCIGMHLARLQIKVGLEELLARATRIRLQPGTVLERRPGVAQIFQRLPIEFDPIGVVK